jgi:kynurenine 3-monooxygenase
VPFYGQGANASFEDCLVLAECLRGEPDRTRALARYQALRKPNTDALADLAVGNFLEMRDKVASPLFHAKKRFEKLLHALFPRWFVPLYTMVSFTRIPYAVARARASAQWRWVWRALAAVVLVALWLVLA